MDGPLLKEFSQHKQRFSGSVKAGGPSYSTFPTGLFQIAHVSPGLDVEEGLLYHLWYFLFSVLSWCSSPSLFHFQVSSPLSCIFLCPPLNFAVSLRSFLRSCSLPASIFNVFQYSLFFLLSRVQLGDAFPWTISLSQFSLYTLLGQQRSLSLLEPMGCTSTLAVTSHKQQSGSEGRHSFVVCLHVDLQPIHVKCSNPQVSEADLNSAK